jgi:hypothetical protein
VPKLQLHRLSSRAGWAKTEMNGLKGGSLGLCKAKVVQWRRRGKVGCVHARVQALWRRVRWRSGRASVSGRQLQPWVTNGGRDAVLCVCGNKAGVEGRNRHRTTNSAKGISLGAWGSPVGLRKVERLVQGGTGVGRAHGEVAAWRDDVPGRCGFMVAISFGCSGVKAG